MRDEHYRNLCDNPNSYDKMIDFIKANNSYIKDYDDEKKEEFAIKSIHDCIRPVVFGDNEWVSTGGCIAVRASSNSSLLAYKKVVLGYLP